MVFPFYPQQQQQTTLHIVWNFSGHIIIGSCLMLMLYVALNRWLSSSKKFLCLLYACCKRIVYGRGSSGSNELQRFLSSSSSDSSVGSEISSDPEYDDLLASVSLLFQQEDDQEEQVSSCYQKHDSGTIIARILPKGDVEYEKTKPVENRRSDAPLLRSLIKEDLSEARGTGSKGHSKCFYVPPGDYSDPNGLMVALEVDINVTTLPSCETERPRCKGSGEYLEGDKNQKLVARQHHLHMQMHRDADESVKRTLKRLQLSAVRKIRSQIQAVDQSLRFGDTKRRGKQPKTPIHPSEHKLANKKFNESPSLEPSIWIIENSQHSGTGEVVESGGNSQVGRRRALQHRSSSQRKMDLTYSEITQCDHRQSIELWKELVDYDKSHLYLDLHDNGPLLALEVDACPPTIISIVAYEDFKSRAYVGIPLVVEAKLIHSTNAMIAWFIEEKDGQLACRGASNVSSCSPARCIYTPTLDDVGKTISVLIAPLRPGHYGLGFEEAYKFHNAVEERPFLPLVRPLREFWTLDRAISKASSNCLRVLSYNLLADWYAGRSAAEDVFNGKESSSNFYNHCNGEYLRKERRFPLLAFEILSYHPDLICLQEVDSSVYDSLFRPIFEAHGYQGYYSNKASVQVEGCAMFWSLQYFEKAEIADMHHFYLRDLLSQHKAPGTDDSSAIDAPDSWRDSMDSIDQLLECNPHLRHVVTSKVSQVVQIARLKLRRDDQERTKPESLVVGNTHLFYHPMADHIRLIQASQVCRQLDIIRRQRSKTSDSNPGEVCPIVLCGDLNSHPLSGAVQLLLQGRIGPEHFEAWKNLNEYSWEMGDEDFLLEHGYIGNNLDDDNDPTFVNEAFEDAREDISEDEAGGVPNTLHSDESVSKPNQDFLKTIVFPGTFPTLISGYPEMPEFTNYSVGFDETLDYIFVSAPSPTEEYGLEPEAAAPLPTREQMQNYGAMPNEFMPSDHLSLVCDLSWKRN